MEAGCRKVVGGSLPPTHPRQNCNPALFVSIFKCYGRKSKEMSSQCLIYALSLEKQDRMHGDPGSNAGGLGPYLRSLDHLGRSSEATDRKNPKKVK